MARTEERKKNFRNISCEVNNSLFKKLEWEAKLRGTSKAEIIRAALRDYLYIVK